MINEIMYSSFQGKPQTRPFMNATNVINFAHKVKVTICIASKPTYTLSHSFRFKENWLSKIENIPLKYNLIPQSIVCSHEVGTQN